MCGVPAAQPSASGSRAASAWTRPCAAERASMPPDRSTAITSGHTCAIKDVSRPVPEPISTARPGPERAAAGQSISKHRTPVPAAGHQSRAAASNPAAWQPPPAGPR